MTRPWFRTGALPDSVSTHAGGVVAEVPSTQVLISLGFRFPKKNAQRASERDTLVEICNHYGTSIMSSLMGNQQRILVWHLHSWLGSRTKRGGNDTKCWQTARRQDERMIWPMEASPVVTDVVFPLETGYQGYRAMLPNTRKNSINCDAPWPSSRWNELIAGLTPKAQIAFRRRFEEEMRLWDTHSMPKDRRPAYCQMLWWVIWKSRSGRCAICLQQFRDDETPHGDHMVCDNVGMRRECMQNVGSMCIITYVS